jgi:hypothetical protein
VLVRRIAATVHNRPHFVHGVSLVDLVAVALYISVQVGDIRRNDAASGVSPGPGADTVARVDGRLIPRSRRA